MIKSGFLCLAFLVYPILITFFNDLIRRRIISKTVRDQIKQENEYLIKLVYLLLPLAVLHLEFFYMYKGYSFTDFNTSTFLLLIVLQVMVFIIAIYRFFKFWSVLNHYTS